MKNAIIVLVFAFTMQNAYSQNKSKFSVEINYGLNGNFFLRDYDEIGEPADKKYFFKKNFVGTTTGISLTYLFNQKNGIFVEYDRSVNIGKFFYSSFSFAAKLIL